MPNLPASSDISNFTDALVASEYQRAIVEAVNSRKAGDSASSAQWADYATSLMNEQYARKNNLSIFSSVQYSISQLPNTITHAAQAAAQTVAADIAAVASSAVKGALSNPVIMLGGFLVVYYLYKKGK